MVRIKGSPGKKKISTTKLMIGNKEFKVRNSLLRTIRKLQTSTKNCIPQGPLYKLIREILQEICVDYNMRIQLLALEALQESAEMYLIGLFEDANLLAAHAKRITLRNRDIQLVLAIRGSIELYRR